MSPRRRLALGALVLALLLAVGVVVVRPLLPAGGVAQDVGGPVLLVPGYGGDVRSLEPLAAALRSGGRDAVVVPAVGDGTGDLRAQADRLARAADDAVAAGAPSVDVVGYSAGGVVARLWVDELGGAETARRIVTLGSPHHGTDIAGLGAATGACPEACRQLAPGSDLLEGLAEAPSGPAWTSIWTGQDETVTPPESAQLAGAVDVEVQAVCADARVAHGQLPRDALVVGVVLQALGERPLEERPAASECAALRSAGARALGGGTGG
ncbi:lipase family alpha/beta hydrolase [Phycicoccus avicenniae]|uniref:lipase family alpha/beta hydrolase n=1 Tax=Phycicoccus avicenniae TaxID=2828860 RepID=UPI003D2C742F